ncbi:MAG TPA: division plane positioning ATPase MipZ [Caulobacteraceae bacterium]|nr:division plane positioning ATPase MipZ [Caulobacteraceae bacterium]
MRVIVVGNEKGGAGKSTIAVHLAVALAHEGAAVAVLDLDRRQQSLAHFFANRASWIIASGAQLPEPRRLASVESAAALDAALAETGDLDYLVVDTPGADTELSRAAHRTADLIVTPMNDSFVDFDVLGVVDPVTLDLVRPSLYSETVWEARKLRAAERGRSIDWVVLRNRLASAEARNRRRVDDRVAALSKRVGFRTLQGLRDRVIYRELFPFGLTVADIGSRVRPVPVSLGQVAARQEMRVLMADLGLAPAPGAILAAE